jgi:hypothetical protein
LQRNVEAVLEKAITTTFVTKEKARKLKKLFIVRK